MPLRTYFRFGFQIFDEFGDSLTFGSFRWAYAEDGMISLEDMKEDTGFNSAKERALGTLGDEEGAYLGDGLVYNYVVYDSVTKERVATKTGIIRNNRFLER